MKIIPWLVLLSLTLVSCSGSKSAQNVDEETPQIELSDADEFIETPAGDNDSFMADGSLDMPGDAPLETNEVVSEPVEPVMGANETFTEIDNGSIIPDSEPLVQDTSSLEASPVETVNVMPTSEAGTMKQYTVQKNETLMLIAFKLYGDYERWKELANQNQDVLNRTTNIKEGTVLNYEAPAEEFVWNPQGLPYLIRTGDTLGGISKQVYADVNKWKMIWDNNRPLIKDPNKIYAGFTIFYLENGREVANEL